MSFDIFFQPCRFAPATEEQDPGTGQARKILPNEPLTAIELAAVQKVLAELNASGADQFGCYRLEFEDGGSAEVFGQNLERGCMVALRGLTKDILRFLFDFLRAGNWVMIPAMRETRAIATSLSSFKHVPEGFPPAVVCQSPAK
jgi:hypothetical protein